MGRKAVFMDIDGTLMEHGRVSERVVAAIQAARALGHQFFVCTGRSRGFVPQILKDADYLDGFVMACGMHCEKKGETVYRQRIPLEILLKVARYFCASGNECLFDGENYMIGLNSQRSDCVNSYDFAGIEASLRAEPVSKITVPGSTRAEDAAFLSEWFTVYDMGGWSDVVPVGISKATGMQHMLDYIGAAREDCIGVGDGTNDLPMIEFAGLGVAMGNAPEEVRLAADAVTETCANDGVAAMIWKYVMGNET